MVVARVEGEPPSVEIDFEPGAEIHRRGIGRNADITEITGAVTRGDIHAPAQCHRQMREVAADADAFLMAFESSPVGTRVLVAEANPVMGIVANRLHALPARPRAGKQRPTQVCKFLSV